MKTVKTNQKTKLLFLVVIVTIMLMTVAKNAITDGSVTQQVYGDSTLIDFDVYTVDNKATFSPIIAEDDGFIAMIAIEPSTLSCGVYEKINPTSEFMIENIEGDLIIFFRTTRGITSVKFTENKKRVLLNGRLIAVRSEDGLYKRASTDFDKYKDTKWKWEHYEDSIRL